MESTLVCHRCGKIFTREVYPSTQHNHYFCSAKCSALYNGRNSRFKKGHSGCGGRPKGIPSHRKGLTFEEEYDVEKAEEIKAKISEASKGREPWNKGKIAVYSRETLRQMSDALKGHKPWNKGLTKKDNETVNAYAKKVSEAVKQLWKNPDYVRRQMKANNVKPNKKELYLNSFLQKHFPNKWRYVGDGKVIIGGKCPDFIHNDGEKKVIELFGNYWHTPEEEEKRIDSFKTHGYETLIIWEHELEDEGKLLVKLLEGSFGE